MESRKLLIFCRFLATASMIEVALWAEDAGSNAASNMTENMAGNMSGML